MFSSKLRSGRFETSWESGVPNRSNFSKLEKNDKKAQMKKNLKSEISNPDNEALSVKNKLLQQEYFRLNTNQIFDSAKSSLVSVNNKAISIQAISLIGNQQTTGSFIASTHQILGKCER